MEKKKPRIKVGRIVSEDIIPLIDLRTKKICGYRVHHSDTVIRPATRAEIKLYKEKGGPVNLYQKGWSWFGTD